MILNSIFAPLILGESVILRQEAGRADASLASDGGMVTP
jgi:hypothetical protein